ncbi:hypothetical protein [Chachezhania sediminis]|uniref:hypothetical protein n=1 Tax=Chachezhania sediminis TaxID=2599291 RepID=UPI00131CF160|nr:hypothetical protein [Chachezhania sediminis]
MATLLASLRRAGGAARLQRQFPGFVRLVKKEKKLQYVAAPAAAGREAVSSSGR